MIRILSRIKSEPWAITREVMDTIMEVAQRENMSPEMVAQKMGRPLENTYDVEYRDGVAILPVQGPLFRYANLFTMISGATSYDTLARDFARAMDDPRVESILLNIDSPGGEANGVSEFADQIAAARGKKPIVAYVGGLGASAAYWLASAADEIIASDTALLGSIGTVMSVTDTRERDAKNGVKNYEVVSSQSPYKRTDPSTDAGRAKMQELVDSLSDVFVSKIAGYRGTDTETVLKNYGQGGVLVGQAAVNAGLADRLGSFEGVVAELTNRARGFSGSVAAAAGGADIQASKEIDMDPKQNSAPAADTKPEQLTAAQVAEKHPEAADALRAEGHATGATAERARVQGILASDEAAGRGELAQHLAFETGSSVESALAMLSKSPKSAEQKGTFAEFNAAMKQEGNANVGADQEPNPGNEVDDLINTAKAMGLA